MRRLAFPSNLRRRPAFTLLELLTAMAVLTVLAIFLVQVISLTSSTSRISNQAVDAAAQARLAFDRIGLDMGAMVKRPDTDFGAVNHAAGPTNLMLFLSSVISASSAANNRGLSAIAYRVDAHPDNKNQICLVRAGKALGWSDVGFAGLQANDLPTAFTDAAFSSYLPQSADFDVLAPGVFRAVVGFQLYPDNRAVTLMDGSDPGNNGKSQGQIVYSPPVKSLISSTGGSAVNYVDLDRVSSIVVGLVSLDLDNLKRLDATQIVTLSNAFGAAANGQLPMAAWEPIAENPNAFPSSIPLPARQAIRVFQRFFPVTSFGAKSS